MFMFFLHYFMPFNFCSFQRTVVECSCWYAAFLSLSLSRCSVSFFSCAGMNFSSFEKITWKITFKWEKKNDMETWTRVKKKLNLTRTAKKKSEAMELLAQNLHKRIGVNGFEYDNNMTRCRNKKLQVGRCWWLWHYDVKHNSPWFRAITFSFKMSHYCQTFRYDDCRCYGTRNIQWWYCATNHCINVYM